jgi:hypothetical protein
MVSERSHKAFGERRSQTLKKPHMSDIPVFHTGFPLRGAGACGTSDIVLSANLWLGRENNNLTTLSSALFTAVACIGCLSVLLHAEHVFCFRSIVGMLLFRLWDCSVNAEHSGVRKSAVLDEFSIEHKALT